MTLSSQLLLSCFVVLPLVNYTILFKSRPNKKKKQKTTKFIYKVALMVLCKALKFA